MTANQKLFARLLSYRCYSASANPILKGENDEAHQSCSYRFGVGGRAVVGLRPGSNANAQDLDRLCLDRIARFKRPKQYRFVESLPKNNYGKVLKTVLREHLAVSVQRYSPE